ncbi:MAG: TonB-dependent receptor [Opitutus sp.]|nr:TonB-dependent receptor [Opitutus sp.]
MKATRGFCRQAQTKFSPSDWHPEKFMRSVLSFRHPLPATLTPTMIPPTVKSRALLVSTLTVLALTGLYAQTAPTGAATTRPKTSDDIITLSEFSVKADPDRGYAPSETMTGSRVATKIVDLPYTVNVLTSEFLDDFGIFELADNIVQIGSFTGLDIGGNFFLRGFQSTYQLRDGFFRLGRYGSSNVDRIEIIKGSNAAIYGRTSPGGMINMISKAPKDRQSEKISYNVGDYGTKRITLEATGPVPIEAVGKTSYIVTASQYERNFGQEYARNRNIEYYGALKHTFANGGNLVLSGEYLLQIRHSPNGGSPLINDQKGTAVTTDDEIVGYAKNLAQYNAYGPNSELTRGGSSFTANYDKRLNDIWSVRSSANYYRMRRWDYNSNNGWPTVNINPAVATAPITVVRGAVPSKGQIIEDGGGVQGDILAHYWTNNRKIEHRTLFAADVNDYYRWDPSRSYAAATDPDLLAWNAAARTVTLDPVSFRPISPINYFPKWFDGSKGVSTRIRKQRVTVAGGLIRQQTALFNGDLLTYFGARYDGVRFRHRDFTAPPAGFLPGQLLDKKMNSGLKPNFGVNYKLTPALRVFANYSESYFVEQSGATPTVALPSYVPETAEGYDYGFKGSVLNDRLNFTVSGFYATRHNVSVTEFEETPPGSGTYVTVTRRDGDQLVRGYELDVNYNVTNEVNVGGSWGNVFSIYTNFGSAAPQAVGRRVNGVSPQNGGAYIKYTPSNAAWRGFSTNLNVTHVASTPTQNPNQGDVTAVVGGKVVVLRSTNQWRIRTPSYTLWNFGIRYKLPYNLARMDHTLAVNINNLFDLDYLRANSIPGDRRSIFFTYTLGHSGARR